MSAVARQGLIACDVATCDRPADEDECWTEIRFEDCPRMTPAMRAQSLREGYVVAAVEKAADGSLRCTAEFRLKG